MISFAKRFFSEVQVFFAELETEKQAITLNAKIHDIEFSFNARARKETADESIRFLPELFKYHPYEPANLFRSLYSHMPAQETREHLPATLDAISEIVGQFGANAKTATGCATDLLSCLSDQEGWIVTELGPVHGQLRNGTKMAISSFNACGRGFSFAVQKEAGAQLLFAIAAAQQVSTRDNVIRVLPHAYLNPADTFMHRSRELFACKGIPPLPERMIKNAKPHCPAV